MYREDQDFRRKGRITENTEKVENITVDNVTVEDKDDLIAAKDDLENALENFGGNYTEDEKTELENKLEQINKVLESIEKVETVQGAIILLPESVMPDDTAAETLINAVKEQYEALSEHEKSLISEELKAKLESLLDNLLDYQIIEGNGSLWTVGDDGVIIMIANGSVEKFVGIEVDGKSVDTANYTVKAGSTVITLNSEYLAGLTVGKHTLSVIYTDSQTEGWFEILEKSEPATPDTEDSGNVILWFTMMLVAVCGLVANTAVYRRRKHNRKHIINR